MESGVGGALKRGGALTSEYGTYDDNMYSAPGKIEPLSVESPSLSQGDIS